VYALYESYGFDQDAIAQLFVAGFGSSLIFGTFVGSLSDKYGRKLMCLVYCACYIVSALTKTVPVYSVLMVGRILSGVATSLLFSSFEAWMVCEHNNRGFDPRLLGDTFGLATFGNGIIAVLSGLIAGIVAANNFYVGPFLLSIVPLTILGIIVQFSWTENYGDQTIDVQQTFYNAWELIKNDRKILLLGAAQSTYEGAMYAFVFLWTPALSANMQLGDEDINFGLIFAVFMVCVMIGSSLFRLAAADLYQIPLVVHVLACISMLPGAFLSRNKPMVYLGFLVFEISCGMFWPAYGTIRSKFIPEDSRAAVSNFFRIPLNVFVVFVLLKIKALDRTVVFFILASVHGISVLLYQMFMKERNVAESSYVKVANTLNDGSRVEMTTDHA
jgi:MFS family permease